MNFTEDKWSIVPIGEIAKIQYGSSIKSSETADGYKTFRMNELMNGVAVDNGRMKSTTASEKEFSKYKLNKTNILFNRTNSFEHVGRTGIFLLDGDYMFASYLLRLEVDQSRTNPYFLNTIMNSDWFQTNIKQYATKAVGQANINAQSLSNFKIKLPPIEEQFQLSSLFQSIENTIADVETQEKNLKRLRKHLINKLSKKDFQFGVLIDESKIEEVQIGSIVSEITDRTDNPSTSGFKEFVGLEDFESGELTIQKYSSTDKLVSAMKLCKKQDILFARRNAYLKRSSIVEKDCVCSGDVIILRPNIECVLPFFLASLMNTDEFWDYAICNAAGTMSKRVKYRDLAKYTVKLPELKVQAEINLVFEQIENIIKTIIDLKINLKNLKQTLLNEILE